MSKTPILDELREACRKANNEVIRLSEEVMHLDDKLDDLKELPKTDERDKEIALLEEEVDRAVKMREIARAVSDAASHAEIMASGPEVEAEREIERLAYLEKYPPGWNMYDQLCRDSLNY